MAQDHSHSRRSNPDLHRHGHRSGHYGADMRLDDLLQLLAESQALLNRATAIEEKKRARKRRSDLN